MNVSRSIQVMQNRQHIKAMLNVTSFLRRQGLAFRGDDESVSSTNRGNFMEMVIKLCDTDQKFKRKNSTKIWPLHIARNSRRIN